MLSKKIVDCWHNGEPVGLGAYLVLNWLDGSQENMYKLLFRIMMWSDILELFRMTHDELKQVYKEE